MLREQFARRARRRSGALLVAVLLFGPAALAQVVPLGLGFGAQSDYPITPIPSAPAADPRKIELGQRLFNDPHLSGSGTRACTSCHEVSTNGADAQRLDLDPEGRPLSFNTNTVFNAGLSYRMNWEGNLPTLEDQAAGSLADPQLMASSVENAVSAVNHDKVLHHQFELVYGHAPDRAGLLDAISTYEKSLVTPDSRFDLWMKGDATALSAEEVQGYELFTSFGCVSCHQGVNVGGNLFERSGIFHPLRAAQRLLLRVPSLRNVAVTAPYFHDGSTSNLTNAVLEMGYAQLDRQLSDDQVKAVTAFLTSLTGRYHGHLLTSPPQ